MMISSQQMIDTLLAGMQSQQQTVATATSQLSSGRSFSTADQNPLAYEKSLSIRDMQSGVKGSLSALDTAGAQLGMSQNVLQQMLPLLQRAQVLAVQQSSVNNASSLTNTAALGEVKTLQQQFLAFANQTWQGQPLFAGTNTGVTSAFTMNTTTGAVTYNGNAQDQTMIVSPTQTVVASANGGNAGFMQAFNAFKNFSTALSSGNVAGMQTAINDFGTAYDSMNALTAKVGGTLGSVNMRKAAYQSLQTQVATSLSNNESADIAKASTQLNQANVSLQAIYSVLARVNSVSLLNYLK